MIVLASSSPRRSELLRLAGFEFTVRAGQVDESLNPGEAPEDYVKRLAEKKALSITAEPGEIVLGADTTVALGDDILGKPGDHADARRMLEKLAGRRHEVYTGVCLKTSGRVRTEFACTRVWFDTMSTEEIDAYIASGEPLDKAGGYAIQGLASKFIQRIEGSYSNVVGLPVELVHRMLKAL